MKSTYIWAVGISLVLAAVIGCDKGAKRTTVMEAPSESPPPAPLQQYPEPAMQPMPEPAPVAAVPQTPPTPPAGDVYTPPADGEAEPLPPETVTRSRPRPRPATAQPKESYAPARSRNGRTYTVKKGDTLQTISRQYYGTVTQWRKIYNANRNILKDPDKVVVGTRLTIPPK